MFSRKERHFLTLLVVAERDGVTGERALAGSFPSPAYRRKLLWGIRRKAEFAAADWELYARAASVESKVLPRPAPLVRDSPPVVADPLLGQLRKLRRAWKRTSKDCSGEARKSGSSSVLRKDR